MPHLYSKTEYYLKFTVQTVKHPSYCSNVPELLKVILMIKKIKKHNWDNRKKHTMYDIHLYIDTVYKGWPWLTG